MMMNGYEEPMFKREGHIGRRSRFETLISIMECLMAGAKIPTHLMYESNLSWAVMKDYLIHLERIGYVQVIPQPVGKRIYALTPAGQMVARVAHDLRIKLKPESVMPSPHQDQGESGGVLGV